jgi:hypothetical protein
MHALLLLALLVLLALLNALRLLALLLLPLHPRLLNSLLLTRLLRSLLVFAAALALAILPRADIARKIGRGCPCRCRCDSGDRGHRKCNG